MISVRIHSPYNDESGYHEYWEHPSSKISHAQFDVALCSGEYKVGNVAVSALRVTVPHYQYDKGAKVELFRDGVKIHGDFYIENRQPVKRGFWLELVCYDDLYQANMVWTKEPEGKKKKISAAEIMNEICLKIGISWSGSLINPSEYPYEDIMGKKLSEILGIIAKDNGGNFAMREGVLTFIPLWYSGKTVHVTKNSMVMDDFNLNYSYFTKIKMGKFAEGDDSGDTLEINSNYATEEKCRAILSNISGEPYKSFSVKKAAIQDDFEIGDKVEFMTDRAGIIYKPTKISMVYSDSGCFASLSAGRSEESRKEFQYKGPITSALENKIDKNRDYNGNKFGDYGFRSTAVRPKTPTGRMRTASAEEVTDEIQVHGAELVGRDVTDEENPVECGKVFIDRTDEANKSVNMAMKGLLTQAQDVRGAINELFNAGTSGGWVRPAEWIELPEPEDNQITIHVVVSDILRQSSANLMFQSIYSANKAPPAMSIDWGNGERIDSDVSWWFESPKYSEAGQYIITMTSESPSEVNVILQLHYNIAGLKIGKGFSPARVGISIASGVKEISIYGNSDEFSVYPYLQGLGSFENVEKIYIPCLQTVTAIGGGFMSNANLASIGTLILPNVRTVGDAFLQGVKGLAKVSMPMLESAGNGFCNSCLGLETVEIPDTAVLGANAFYQSGYLKRVAPSAEEK